MYFIGVDISKSKVDCALINGQLELLNEKVVINVDSKLISYLRAVIKLLKTEVNQVLVCCESTGIYNEPLRRACASLGIGLWEEQALKIKRASTNLRGKNDKQDALRIAEYAVRYNDRQHLYQLPDAQLKMLSALTKSRDTLISQRVMIANQLREAKSHDQKLHKILADSYRTTLRALDQSIEKLETQIDTLIARDESLSKNKQLLESVTAIGPQIANNLILATNNFKDFKTAKQLACYAGVVPFENQSGTIIKRPRVSSLANKKLKSLLHLAAMCAIRFDQELKAYYIRKVSEGKNKMSIINAVRNKLVHRIMAVIQRQSPFVKSQKGYYQNSNLNTCFSS